MFISCDIPFIYIIIYNDYIRDKDYHSLCDYIIIDMIIFLFICCLCISLLSMMLLYKDNYPYVVIEIYFLLCLLFLGSMIISGILCSFIFHILSL